MLRLPGSTRRRTVRRPRPGHRERGTRRAVRPQRHRPLRGRPVAVEGRSAAPGRRTRLANRTGHTASAGRRPSACRRGGRGRWRSRSGTGTRPPRRGVRHGSTHTAARRLTPRARQGMDTGRPGVHAAHRVWRSPARDGLNPARQVTGRKLRARSVPTGHLVSLFPSGAPAALPVLKKVGTPTTTPMKAVRR